MAADNGRTGETPATENNHRAAERSESQESTRGELPADEMATFSQVLTHWRCCLVVFLRMVVHGEYPPGYALLERCRVDREIHAAAAARQFRWIGSCPDLLECLSTLNPDETMSDPSAHSQRLRLIVPVDLPLCPLADVPSARTRRARARVIQADTQPLPGLNQPSTHMSAVS